MAANYPAEKFRHAVRSLAVGRERLQDRLVKAYLCFHSINPEQDIPDTQLRARYMKLRAALTRGGPQPKGDEGLVAATCRQLSDDDAQTLASEICDLGAEFRDEWERVRTAAHRGK